MQLLKLQFQVIKIVVVCGGAAHVIRIFLQRDGAIVSGARMPRGDKATLLSAGLVRGGALIVRMIDGKAPMANLPQRTVVLVMVGGLLCHG